jgi:poly-beta-hydroxyalkanoate depolymerase
MNEQAKVFFSKISEKINRGFYDEFITIPFMSKRLILKLIESNIEKKLLTKATPILSEQEIKNIINEVKETALITTQIFIKIGLIEKVGSNYKISNICKKILNN